jgi:hypothetical protein
MEGVTARNDKGTCGEVLRRRPWFPVSSELLSPGGIQGQLGVDLGCASNVLVDLLEV